MNDTKLISLLQSFNSSEIKWCRIFLDSPYFNKNKKNIELFEYLVTTISKKRNNLPVREEIFKHLFPEAKYNDLKLRHLMSDLLKLLESFLVFDSLKEDINKQNLVLLRILRERQLNKHYQYSMRNTKKVLDHTPQDDMFYYNKYLLQFDQNQYYAQQQLRSNLVNLSTVNNNLEIFYQINKLKVTNQFLNYQNVIEVKSDSKLNDDLDSLKSEKYEDIPIVQIHYLIFLSLMESENEEHFYKIIDLLDVHAHKFNIDEAREMYTIAQNYCIKKINKGETKFLKESLSLYKTVLDKGFILEKDYLSPWHYKNIVVIGLRLNEFDWVEMFINKYKEKISPSYRENAYTYNIAKFHFYKKEYKIVLGLLQKVEFEDIFYNLDSKTMLLKIYFELGEINALHYLIESFELFIRRNKLIGKYHKTTYLNLIGFIKKLTNIPDGEKDKFIKIKEQILKTKQVADITWLIEKVESKL
ncbi:MAG: hypothetical protein JKY33_07430 [Bacteroidia bacterium]|nr:hypothetical protein [Bacteroidia bacterium]